MYEIWIKRMVSWIIRHKMFYRRLHFYIKKPLALIARRAFISMFAASALGRRMAFMRLLLLDNLNCSATVE